MRRDSRYNVRTPTSGEIKESWGALTREVLKIIVEEGGRGKELVHRYTHEFWDIQLVEPDQNPVPIFPPALVGAAIVCICLSRIEEDGRTLVFSKKAEALLTKIAVRWSPEASNAVFLLCTYALEDGKATPLLRQLLTEEDVPFAEEVPHEEDDPTPPTSA